jgi:peptidoglycan/LPS O-acetylase OafA/YrhL
VKWIYKLTDISNVKRISFRHDINGLRAIAVLAVVFYHAELKTFKGGWLGVDIFFVISGYLISNIIISELNEGTFSFKNFYLRRVLRILPALFSTLLFTIPLAYFFLTPKAMEEYLDSLIASVFFYANYHFMNLDFYVAESTKLMPLLHTWSLAIEEQYYLLFPLISFFIYKYFKKYFTFFIGFITLGSLYLNTFYQSSDKFYRLEFRIWELLLGVLVMILSSNFKIKHLEKIGLPLMLFPILYFGDSWINDSEPKIIALTGVSLIIFSNTDSSIITKILRLKIINPTISKIKYRKKHKR